LWFKARLGKKFVKPHLNRKMLGMIAHPSYGKKFKAGGSQSRLNWAKCKTLFQKPSEQKGVELWLKW
jgi:hypothetical protein